MRAIYTNSFRFANILGGMCRIKKTGASSLSNLKWPLFMIFILLSLISLLDIFDVSSILHIVIKFFTAKFAEFARMFSAKFFATGAFIIKEIIHCKRKKKKTDRKSI